MPAPRLDLRIPEEGFRDSSAMLDAFLAWASDAGFALYPHQEEAVLELFSGHHAVLDAPTGSGKSLVATALHFKTFAETGRTFYTAPIKALVSEKFFALAELFGAENVGMMTGDGAVNRDAPIVACTAEILANLALREGSSAWVSSVVMDEFHYYADRDRGMAWQVPLLLLRDTQFLLMSATLGDTSVIRDDLEARTARKVAAITSVERPVPLHFRYAETPIHETIDGLLRENKAPIYIVHFSQRAATEQAQALTSIEVASREHKQAIGEAIGKFRFDTPFGPTLKRFLLHGIAVHHAGLLPRYRLLVEKLAQQGLLKVICGTDTLGVGINVPLRTVLFSQLCKYDGENTVILPVRDFKQIAGRAGRAGFDVEGLVVAQAPEHVIDNKRAEEKAAQSGKKKNKVNKKGPPPFGYRHWDATIFQQLIERPPEPLKSRLTIDHGRLLTMMQHGQDVHADAKRGFEDLCALIETSHESRGSRDALLARARGLVDDFVRAGILDVGDPGDAGARWALDPDLQRDFSLHHSLSLFLVSALGALDPNSPEYALDVVTFTEAILEDPMPVLIAQQSKEKGRVVAELKSAGVPYEERTEALEKVTWPKPLADVLDAIFHAYAGKHPWVLEAELHPKSIARAMAAEQLSFADFIKDLGILRAEGVLLRYLTEAYKALVQNVPEAGRTDAFEDVLAYLRMLLARVDASLVTEWEKLVAGQGGSTEPVAQVLDISRDTRTFRARVRAELHAIVRQLALRDWEEAALTMRPGDTSWSAVDVERALAPFLEEWGDVRFDHVARLAEHTTITSVGPHVWEVRQALLAKAPHQDDPSDEDAATGWAIEGRIDLRQDTNPEGPLVEVQRIA